MTSSIPRSMLRFVTFFVGFGVAAVTPAFAAPSFAGVYFGSIVSHPSAGTAGPSGGKFAMIVGADNTGYLLAYEDIPAFLGDLPAGGVYAHMRVYVGRRFSVDAQGAFNFSAVNYIPTWSFTGGAQPAPAPVDTTPNPTVTISSVPVQGLIAGGGTISGTVGGSSTLAAARVSDSGAESQYSGFYVADEVGTSTQLLAIIAADGETFVVTYRGDFDAGTGTVDASGTLSALLVGQPVTAAMAAVTTPVTLSDSSTGVAQQTPLGVTPVVNPPAPVPVLGSQQVGGTIDPVTGVISATISREAGLPNMLSGANIVSAAAASGRLLNLSSRSQVDVANPPATLGFVVPGPEAKSVLIRAAGPALRNFGISDALPAPRLNLDLGVASIATNTGWGNAANVSDIAAVANRVGAFPFASGSADSAILITLAPGAYTALAAPADGQSGVALVEAYDVSDGTGHPFPNVSSRATIAATNDTLVTGFVVGGSVPKRVLLRAAGPALARLGVANPMAQPQLTLTKADGTLVAANTGWTSTPEWSVVADAGTRTGAFAFSIGSADDALIVNLAPGAYTAHVTGANGSTGVVLVEAYDLP